MPPGPPGPPDAPPGLHPFPLELSQVQILGRMQRPEQGLVQIAAKKRHQLHFLNSCLLSQENLRMMHNPEPGLSVHPGQQ